MIPISPEQVLCILGPTASGKTALALEMAERFDAEIISVDSAMVYRQMDIGTAKPDAQTLSNPKHHLVDILDPADSYSAGQFVRDVRVLIDDIRARGKSVILAGGTMMYYQALQQGLAELPQTDPVIREKIAAQALSIGWPAMHRQLELVDAPAADKINPNDTQRIARALEVFQQTGQRLSDLQQQRIKLCEDIDFVNWVLAPNDRHVLHQRIEQRFDLMIEQGFIAEVQQLRQRADLHLDLASMRSVGYRQVWQYLDGDYDIATMKDKALAATRQLAKRQLTWLRQYWPDAYHVSV